MLRGSRLMCWGVVYNIAALRGKTAVNTPQSRRFAKFEDTSHQCAELLGLLRRVGRDEHDPEADTRERCKSPRRRAAVHAPIGVGATAHPGLGSTEVCTAADRVRHRSSRQACN